MMCILRNMKTKIDMFKHVDSLYKYSFIYFEILGEKPNNYFGTMHENAKVFDEIVNL